MNEDIAKVLITEHELQARIASMAREITECYSDIRDGITLVTVLTGSIVFVADLVRCLPMRMRIGLVGVSSYPGRARTSQGATLACGMPLDLQDRDVLVVDDISDTGGTLRLVQGEVQRVGPRSVKTTVLLRKPEKTAQDISIDFVGFDIEDSFVVGYGLDYNGLYRNLPYVAVLKPDLYVPS